MGLKEIYSRKKPPELFGRYPARLALLLRPREPVLFQPFLPQREPRAVPVQELESPPPAAAEQIIRPSEGTPLHKEFGDPKVFRIQVKENSEISGPHN